MTGEKDAPAEMPGVYEAKERIGALVRMCRNARDNLRDRNVSADGVLASAIGGFESLESVAQQALAALAQISAPGAAMGA